MPLPPTDLEALKKKLENVASHIQPNDGIYVSVPNAMPLYLTPAESRVVLMAAEVAAELKEREMPGECEFTSQWCHTHQQIHCDQGRLKALLATLEPPATGERGK